MLIESKGQKHINVILEGLAGMGGIRTGKDGIHLNFP